MASLVPAPSNTSIIPSCIPTTCAPCYYSFSTSEIEFPYDISNETQTIPVVAFVTEMPDGSLSTSYSTASTDAPPANATGTVQYLEEFVWTLDGATLTYPTTYFSIQDLSGKATANWSPKTDASCNPTANLSAILLPATTDAAFFILPARTAPATGTESSTLPPSLLSYLDSLPTIKEQFHQTPLASCRPATPFHQILPCLTLTPSTISSCTTLPGSNFTSTTCAVQVVTTEHTVTRIPEPAFTLSGEATSTAAASTRQTAASLLYSTSTNFVRANAPVGPGGTPTPVPLQGEPDNNDNESNGDQQQSPPPPPPPPADEDEDEDNSSEPSNGGGQSPPNSENDNSANGSGSGSGSSNQQDETQQTQPDTASSGGSGQGNGQQGNDNSASGSSSPPPDSQSGSGSGSGQASGNQDTSSSGQSQGGLLGNLQSAINEVASQAAASQAAASQGAGQVSSPGDAGNGDVAGNTENLQSAINEVASQAAASQAAASQGVGLASPSGNGNGNGNDGNGGSPENNAAGPAFIIASQTLTPGGAATFSGGGPISALPSEQGPGVVIAGSQTVSLSDGQATTLQQQGPGGAQGGVEISRSGDAFVVDGQTLSPGQQITAAPTTVSLGSGSESRVVFVDGVPTTFSGAVVTVGGTVYTAVQTGSASGGTEGLGGYIYSGVGGSGSAAPSDGAGSASETGVEGFTGSAGRVGGWSVWSLSGWTFVLTAFWAM